jgi:hypothetical protein
MHNPAISGYARDRARAVSLPVTPLTDGPGGYRTAGRQRPGLWLHYNCKACFDQVWLGLLKKASRHTPTSKKTFKVDVAAADHLPLRYMIAQIYPLSAAIKPFRSRKGHCAVEEERLRQAWSGATCRPVGPGVGPHGRVR